MCPATEPATGNHPRAGNRPHYNRDGLGSTASLTDGAGASVASYSYDVFGSLRSGSPGATAFLFTGEQRDASGLYYLRARYYDPEIGRFLTRDPIPFVNRYAYVGNNPVNYIDPYGLFGLGDLWDAIKCATNPRCVLNELVELVPESELWDISGQVWFTCAIYPEKCAVVMVLAAAANRETERIYGGQPEEGTFGAKEGDAFPGDTFQHCYWSGLITLFLGSGFAEDITTRYEAVPGNDPGQKEFDLHNNIRGIEFAKGLPLEPGSISLLKRYCQ